jgi:membrane protein YdbS with pleckstrin-like domain
MFWFPKPEVVSEQIRSFLAMEQDYLNGSWTGLKIIFTVLVPLSLAALAAALWKRSLWFGISVLIFIAIAKILWSVVFGGDSGTSVIAPAIIGLAVCVVLIFIGFRRLEKRKKETKDA